MLFVPTYAEDISLNRDDWRLRPEKGDSSSNTIELTVFEQCALPSPSPSSNT